MRAALEHGLAGRVGIRQHGSIDVDDDLVSLTRRAGIDAVVERGLGASTPWRAQDPCECAVGVLVIQEEEKALA